MNEIKKKLVALEAKVDAKLFAFPLLGALGASRVAKMVTGPIMTPASYRNVAGARYSLRGRGRRLVSAGGIVGGGLGAARLGAAGAGVGGVAGAVDSIGDPNKGIIGGALGGAVSGGLMGGALGGGIGAARGMNVGRRMAQSKRFQQTMRQQRRSGMSFEIKQRLVELAQGKYQTGTATILGNPITAAMNAKKGKKLDAFGEAYGHGLIETVKGLGVGAGAGAAVGASAATGSMIGGTVAKQQMRGKVRSVSSGRVPRLGSKAVLGRIGGLALPAALIGGAGGAWIGALKGNFDKKAREIRNKYVQ
jgi:hypothetical protein